MFESTNIYEFPDAKGIVVSGDIHGDFKSLVYKCCVQYQMTDTLIVVAGDCGFGFHKPGFYEAIYQKVSKRLAKANNWIVFVRGNHDNPAYFDGQQVNYKRWMAVPDYSILKACGHTILCVGGAISVDRTERGKDEYWPDEAPVYDKFILVGIGKDYAIDAVITHTAPSFCEKQFMGDIQNWLANDEDLLDDVRKERKTMDDIHSFLKKNGHPLRYWYYGDFHKSWHSEIEGVKFNMLDIQELRELL